MVAVAVAGAAVVGARTAAGDNELELCEDLVCELVEVLLCANRILRKIVSRNSDGSLFIGVHTCDALDGGGLTCTVVTEDADDLALVTNDVDFANSIVCSRAVLFSEISNFN